MSKPTHADIRPIKGWTVQATCPNCGGVLSHVADGIPEGARSRSIARCISCGRQFVIQITVTDASPELGRKRGSHPHPDGCTCASHREKGAA